MNQLGEKGAAVWDGAETITAASGTTFNVFKFRTDTVFSSITTGMVTDIADLIDGTTFTAGEEWVIPGVTAFTTTQGIGIAYVTA